MSGIKFFNFNLVSQPTTVITPEAGDENAFFPATNIQDVRTTKVFRSPDGILSAVIVFDFITTEEVDAVLAVPDSVTKNFGFTSLTIEANPTNVWTSPAFSTTLTPSQAEGVGVASFPDKSYRFWRITAVNTTGYVEISKLFIGKSVQLTENNWELGWSKKKRDRSKSQENRHGQKFWDILSRQNSFQGNFSLLTLTEFDLITGIYTANGRHIPVWIILDPDNLVFSNTERYSGYFFLSNDPAERNAHFKLFDLPMALLEAM